MNADFLDAHERHWDDAEILLAQNSLPNADHLYGLSHPLIFQTTEKVSENTLCSINNCENFSINGRNLTSGMVGISS